MKAYDERVLDSYCTFISKAAGMLDIENSKVVLPTEISRRSVLKSVFVHKKFFVQVWATFCAS